MTEVGEHQRTHPAEDEGLFLENKQPKRMQGLIPHENPMNAFLLSSAQDISEAMFKE